MNNSGLIFKWLPSENTSSAKTRILGNRVREYLNLTHKEIVDYLNVICLYLQEEEETDYGDTIK